MNILEQFVEDMFSTIASSDQAKKAKSTMYLLLCDRATRLQSEGMSREEAENAVIAQCDDDIDKAFPEESDVEKRVIGAKEIKGYIDTLKIASRRISVGIMLCILSPILLIAFANIQNFSSMSEQVRAMVGMFYLFLNIAVAAMLFLDAGFKLRYYGYLRKSDCRFDKPAMKYIGLERQIFRRRFKKWVSLGMFFCLAGAFPFIIAQLSPEKNHNFISYASVAAFLPVGIGMFLISLHAVRFFSCGALAASRGKLKKETRFLMLVTAVYWSIVAAVYLTGSFITAKWGRTWIVWPVGMVGYGIVFLVCSFITGKWENQNISNRKRKRINLTVLFVTVFFGLWLMSMGSWYIQPYVSTVPPIETRALDIDYDDDNGIYSITNEEGTDFRVLQLTDIHLGGSFFTQTKDLKALRAVYDLISYTKPDLVIVTGDLVYPIPLQTFSFNNYVPILQFATFMRNIGVPWAFVYGNHDTEFIATHTSDEINDILDDFSYTSNLNFLYNENPPKIYGRNNQLIEVLNPDGSVNQALFLFDSNEYKSRKLNDYDYIRDDQVDWYAELTREINEKEEKCVSSLLFFHIPLEQYKTAYDLYKAGSDEVQYFYGKVGERNEAISCSEHESKLFDTALSLESTKGIFVGHDHYNDISMGYKGIRLTYGKSIDFLAYPGIDKSDWQRGGTLITLHPDSSFDVEPVQLSGLRAS